MLRPVDVYYAEYWGTQCAAELTLLDYAPTPDAFDLCARLARNSAEAAARYALPVAADIWQAQDLADTIVFLQVHASQHLLNMDDAAFHIVRRATEHLDDQLAYVLSR